MTTAREQQGKPGTKTRKRFFGNMLQFLRTCSVDTGRVRWDGDTEAFHRLLELEEEFLHRWTPRYAVIVELVSMAQKACYKVFATDKDKKDGKFALTDLLDNESLEATTNATVDYLFGIPYSYEFRAQLRGITGLDLSENVEISDIVTVSSVDKVPKSDGLFEALMASGLDRDYSLADLSIGDTTLRIHSRGYSSQRSSDSAAAFALSVVKEFLALLTACDFLEVSYSRADRTTTGLLSELPDGQTINWVSDIPLQSLKHVDRFRLSKSTLKRPAGLLDQNPGETVQRSEEEILKIFKRHASRLGRIIRSDADDQAMALRTAAQWYFDATAEDNETNSFIFTSLGFEALLGGKRTDSEGIGVTKLLANRLAYLLGSKRSVRDSMISDFEKFYAIRSAIVHGREPRLSYNAKKVLEQGKYWLKLALSKEYYTY